MGLLVLMCPLPHLCEMGLLMLCGSGVTWTGRLWVKHSRYLREKHWPRPCERQTQSRILAFCRVPSFPAGRSPLVIAPPVVGGWGKVPHQDPVLLLCFVSKVLFNSSSSWRVGLVRGQPCCWTLTWSPSLPYGCSVCVYWVSIINT